MTSIPIKKISGHREKTSIKFEILLIIIPIIPIKYNGVGLSATGVAETVYEYIRYILLQINIFLKLANPPHYTILP